MAIFDKFMGSVKFVEDDYDDDYEYDEDEFEDEEDEEARPKRKLFRFGRKKKDAAVEEEDEAVVISSPKLTPMRGGKSSSKMEVCVIRPTSYDNDVKEIADTLLSNRTVILNMEGLDLAQAQRIIDFMIGACYAIDGNLQKVSNYIFIITPSAVGISGDLQGLVDAFDSAGISSAGLGTASVGAAGIGASVKRDTGFSAY